MAIYKRGDLWHYDFTVGGHRYRGSTGLRGKTAARAYEEQQKERAALGSLGREVPSIEDASARWFQARIAGKKSEKTVAQRLEIMLRLIGPGTLVTLIDMPEIEDAIQRRRLEITHNGRAPTNSTVNRDLIDTTLRPILRYCRKVMKLPVNDIEWSDLKLAEPRQRSRAFTPAEMAAWRAALPEWHRPVFDFMALYGVRLRETFFPLAAVDVPGELITIRKRKNDKPHVVRLTPESARDIAARLGRAEAAKLDTVWFREMKSGKLTAIHWRGFQEASKTALKATGITDARPAHDLRHHAATAVLRAPRGNLKTVQKLLGHENIASTARYAHADDDDVLDALRHVSATTSTPDEKDVIENKGLGDVSTGT